MQVSLFEALTLANLIGAPFLKAVERRLHLAEWQGYITSLLLHCIMKFPVLLVTSHVAAYTLPIYNQHFLSPTKLCHAEEVMGATANT